MLDFPLWKKYKLMYLIVFQFHYRHHVSFERGSNERQKALKQVSALLLGSYDPDVLERLWDKVNGPWKAPIE